VDCGREVALREQYAIEQYPTLILFRHDTDPIVYPGEHTVRDIAQFLRRWLALPVRTLGSAEAVKEFLEDDREVRVLLGVSTEPQGAGVEGADGAAADGAAGHRVLDELYHTVARRFVGEVRFAKTSRANLAGSEAALGPHRIMLYRGEEEALEYEGALDAGNLLGWVQLNAQPMLHSLSSRGYASLMGSGEAVAILFAEEDREAMQHSLLQQAVRRFSKGSPRLQFATASSLQWWQYASNLGVSLHNTPDLVIVDPQHGRHHTWSLHQPAPGPLDSAAVEEFCNAFIQGRLRPSYRTPPAPVPGFGSTQEGKGRAAGLVPGGSVGHPGARWVHELVAARYSTAVQAPQDVVVYFHAPWCVLCVSFGATWLHLAELTQAESSAGRLQLAAYDVHTHGLPEGVAVSHIPKILLYRSGRKEEPLAYSGGQAVHQMITFLKASCTHAWVVHDDEL